MARPLSAARAAQTVVLVLFAAAFLRFATSSSSLAASQQPTPGATPDSAPPDSAPDSAPPGPAPHGVRSLRDFGVLPENSPELNRDRLQAALDWASSCGGVVQVEPSQDPYRVASGLILRANASLVGVHGPVGRGTRHPSKPQPVGSVLQIDDADHPFITVESSTQIRGVQFWYPAQTLRDPAKVIPYPPTIQSSRTLNVYGVTLSCLTFYGEFTAMDFNAHAPLITEQILIEHCYGYPLSGEFIRIDRCYDVPRILHCHVNPANMRTFAGDFARPVVDSVVARRSFTYTINNTDNAQLVDLFTFGVFGGLRLGPATYGQLTNFNFDCVTIGVHKSGDSTFNRNWMLGQGSIIANIGAGVEDIHPFLVDGQGHLALSNVEAFSGPNGAVTALGKSFDFLCVQGDKRLTVSLSGCRMRNYESDHAVTLENPKATVVLTGCFDKDELLVQGVVGVQGSRAP